MKKFVDALELIFTLFVVGFLLSFMFAHIILYFINDSKFAFFLASCCIVPTTFILIYFYERWKNDNNYSDDF